MLHALALAALLLAQDPKAQPKTVEDRLKELDEKISALEKKHKALADENAVLEKKIADGKAAREKFLRQSASAWVQRYGPSIELSEKQSAEFEELWYGWSKEDLEKPYDAARWKTREEALREKLTADQIPRLARKVRDEQQQNAKMTLGMFTQMAKLNAERSAPLEKAVLAKLTIEEGILLAQAHPDKNVSWTRCSPRSRRACPRSPRRSRKRSRRRCAKSWNRGSPGVAEFPSPHFCSSPFPSGTMGTALQESPLFPEAAMTKIPVAILLTVALTRAAAAQETIWVEAEHLDGVRGYCWPGGQNPKTDGHWGISGPGWAAEWTQGGESNFMSIACGAADDKAVAGLDLDVPVAGAYRVWVRFRDNRGATSRFQVRLGSTLLTYGEKPVVEEDNEMKLYWDWAFAWEGHEATLPKGKVRLDLLSAFQEKQCRQIDCIVLTTDTTYRPLIKERPKHPTEEILRAYRKGIDPKLEPLARRIGDFQPPDSWKPATFRGKGFLYLWNMSHLKWAEDDPKRVPFPYHLGDKDVQAAFEKLYAGAAEVPIFSDPRIVPTFHDVGPSILATDAKDAGKKKSAEAFIRWLESHPDRPWAQMMNYHGNDPVTPAARENFLKYRDRYVGNIAGESLGYFEPAESDVKAATAQARSRRDLASAMTPLCLAANEKKYRAVFGAEWPDAYREVIPCQSIGMTAFAPLSYAWGARTVGYESSAITAGLLSLRMAFLRGAARQNGGLTATYRSCNFGDASTIFSESQSYTKPRNILDNYYSVFSGAGMTWYKMDLWHQYMSGSSMFYHEQGFDEFWIPGGTAAAGVKEVQLSPKGKLVDRFLHVTAQHRDRGTPFTPVAFLVDYAHGWDPAPFVPHAFGGMAKRPDLTLYGDHEQMLREYFWTAYHPIGSRSEEPITATNETYVPGVFGDIFDVIYAYPEVKRWSTIQSYPVVIAAGELELTAEEGKRLAQYVTQGGTLLLADSQLSPAAAAALELPELGPTIEAGEYLWTPTGTRHPSQRFRMKPIAGGRPLATDPDGKCFCASFDRGQGRLIVLSVPRGLGIDRAAVPVVARLLAHLTRGLMPLEVEGEVEWMVNRSDTGWIVTLLNSAGQAKPQHGITPTDFRQNRSVAIRSRRGIESATDWLFPEEKLVVESSGAGSRLEVTVPAGGVRIVELKTR